MNMNSAKHGIPDSLLTRLKAARSVVFFTGAGASSESGIPTFRDTLTGLWGKFDAESLATPEAFLRDPALVWGWYEWRRKQVSLAQPNAGHRAMSMLEALIPQVTVITQNVDDLHERAGSQRVIHLHGSLFESRCFHCGEPHEHSAGAADESADGRPIKPPACINCRGPVRPGVVWFHENLPETAWNEAQDASREADLFFVVGTSGLVWPAAELPHVAHLAGGLVVRVNPDLNGPEDFSTIDLVGKAGEILPAMIDRLDHTSQSSNG